MVFSGLEEGLEYIYTIRAATKQGSGPWSEKATFNTTRDMVRAPMSLKAMATSDQSVEVWWEPPTLRHHVHKLYGYQVINFVLVEHTLRIEMYSFSSFFINFYAVILYNDRG